MTGPDHLNDATVAITGGTGSFGQTMTRHLLTRGVGRIHILSRDEAKQDVMRHDISDERLTFFLGDVRDRDSVDNALAGVDHVFHAAALKQVPSCEFFPDQAVKTNIIGSQHVIESAHAHRIRSVVCLSTDKAVYPVNAMGMTKALMEKTAQAFARNNPASATTVSITRYGNVMHSRGSVIPLFVRQIQEGKPLTITAPQMTRFLMSLNESVDLVDHAFTNAQSGDLFVKKAPACTVETLARAVGHALGVEPEIEYIGIRHGEKMFETLLGPEEASRSIDEGDYFRVPLDTRSLDYSKYVDEGQSDPFVERTYSSNNTEQLDVEAAARLVRKIPEISKLINGANR